MSEKFYYHVNLNERGYYFADVRNEDGKTVFEVKCDEDTLEIGIIRDGFMKHTEDLKGLEEHLKDVGLIPLDGELLKGE